MGLIHIYCGNGKGKTTAAIGLAIRAAGSGMKVHIVQLLKGSFTSELETLKLIPNITIERCDRDYGFTFNMSETDKKQIKACHSKILEKALYLAENEEIDLLIIDEFCGACQCDLIDETLADKIVLDKPDNLELVLTGCNPKKKYEDAADYISEIKAVKHPYNRGISARKGIEL